MWIAATIMCVTEMLGCVINGNIEIVLPFESCVVWWYTTMRGVLAEDGAMATIELYRKERGTTTKMQNQNLGNW